MTVGIGVICQWVSQDHIFVASDRMLTADDIEFEPPRLKIYQVTSHVAALIAGDVTPHTTIIGEIRKQFFGRTNIMVAEIARSYAEQFSQLRLRQNIQRTLSPIGMTLDDLKKLRRRNDSSDLIQQLHFTLYESKLDAEAIIAGIDSFGGHLFHVQDPGIDDCHDDVGFVAIGAGQRHAESQFMLNKYTRQWNVARCLLLLTIAKKRSEIAPGVGHDTDFWGINAGGVWSVKDALVEELEKAYQEFDKGERELQQKAYESIEATVAKVLTVEEKKAAVEKPLKDGATPSTPEKSEPER